MSRKPQYEKEWLRETDLRVLLNILGTRFEPTDRKLRLVAVGFLRQAWDFVAEQARSAVELCELACDEIVTSQKRRAAVQACEDEALDTACSRSRSSIDGRPSVQEGLATACARLLDWENHRPKAAVREVIRAVQFFVPDTCILSGLRDIFGNPFKPVAFQPEWRTSTVVSLAKSMYASRDFAPMPLLADALQDAGCEHADILDHCRGTGPHVRGCWVVDGVLGHS